MELDELGSKIDAFADEVRLDLGEIKRGVYGDPKNNVKGLIDTRDDHEVRIEKLEKRLWKVGVMMAAGVAAVDFIIIYIKEFLK